MREGIRRQGDRAAAGTLAEAKASPCVADVFAAFLRIGLLTFGGGLAMLGVLRHELRFRKGWLSEEEFIESASVATSFPGPIAVNMAMAEGFRLRRGPGAAAAVLGVVLPSFVVILAIAALLLAYMDTPRVAGFFKGAGAAVVGLVAHAAFSLGKKILTGWHETVIWLTALGGVAALHLHPAAAIAVSVALGCALGRIGRKHTDGPA